MLGSAFREKSSATIGKTRTWSLSARAAGLSPDVKMQHNALSAGQAAGTEPAAQDATELNLELTALYRAQGILLTAMGKPDAALNALRSGLITAGLYDGRSEITAATNTNVPLP